MKRRTVVLLGLGLIPVAATWRFATAKDEEIIEMVVRRKLDYLRLEPEGVRQFAREFAARHIITTRKLRLLAEISPIYRRWPLSSGRNAIASALRHGEDRITGNYLMGSDFFINGADESREVKFVGLLDFRRACANPFARPPV